MPTALLWFRRDLRLSDHPALVAAVEAAGADGAVVPVFVVDPRLWEPSGRPRRQFLRDCLADLREQTGGALVVRSGDPARVVPDLVRETGAESVHVSFDAGVYGRARDTAVERALGDVPLVRTGSPYGVTPGRLTKNDGTPFKVYSPFARAWRARGIHSPAPRPDAVPWAEGLRSEDLPPAQDLDGTQLPPAGEAAAHDAWALFREQRLAGYADTRNLPGTAGTSRLSPHLKYGTLHPRTLVAEAEPLAEDHGEAVERFVGELIWRDFYADVLWHRPDTAHAAFNPDMQRMRYDTGPVAEEHFAAWAEGRTGYPIVDAGMRQLHGEAWVHNRVRMIVASFLTKDLHVDWWRGAVYFHDHLVDGDIASNHHGWQWVAGTGTDPSPYYRVFNPTRQGQQFDPDGTYVRRWVPELRDVPDRYVHEPWTMPGGPPDGYPAPIVDHAEERQVALARYQAVRDA
ncbi:cryptochrome/photolyase family protein [Geodermatophilus nigrescens]|uniref:Deoxyribodipyrimidine photo-lyase type I n=1 Tax=Geodermatophilus nigrescens TaxID=1070870 RepID=A0A1M5DXL9_9ACTN|nr:deoxyribodipyrimidine photo-lyase [Geodermatophilus nigrescens]SHF71680.1 deoxyribodipyrimidine photo-lyase type I [Geodermatophilus nigrescens]